MVKNKNHAAQREADIIISPFRIRPSTEGLKFGYKYILLHDAVEVGAFSSRITAEITAHSLALTKLTRRSLLKAIGSLEKLDWLE